MNRKLLELALERLKPSDWESFEEFCSQYLASDYPELRTMASPSGDGGRDAELFSAGEASSVVFQYSVTSDWKTKIKKTVERIATTKPDARFLIYMSNHTIGAQADDLRTSLMANGLSLDVRDKNWFLERLEHDDKKLRAATGLVERFAYPYLEGKEIIEKKHPALSDQESKAALIYLGMQWEDENREKGLTKLAFEALIRAALRKTNSDNRLKREEIYNSIESYLPSAEPDKLKIYIDSALKRLEKKCIKHWMKDDEFCLSYEETERLKLRLADLECEESAFNSIVTEYVNLVCEESNKFTLLEKEDIANRVKRIVDEFLLKSGELFALNVVTGNIVKIDIENLKDVIFSDITKYPPKKSISANLPPILMETINEILLSSSEVVRKHLRALSDSYTLFAFLRETPDVQAATKKIFSHGNIWLDTTVILPLIIEALTPNDIDKRYTNIFSALRDSGAKLFVTDGVIQELLHHIKISEACSKCQINEWKGRVPFVFYHYTELGYSPVEFKSWTNLLRGNERPEDDISEYLEFNFGIQVSPLHDVTVSVDTTIKYCVQRLWSDAHEKRRSTKDGEDQENSITSILIKNDVDSYLGIVALRSKENGSELGYKHWWLTIDSIAWKIRDAIKDELKDKTPPSPLMSIDFLINNLAFGSFRSHIGKITEQMLPVMVDLELSEAVPREIIETAERIRQENIGVPDYIIKRKVRDACDKTKRRIGTITKLEINRGCK